MTENGRQYFPITIASGVPAKPGCLAWSPDGTRLAFIGKTLTVYDRESRRHESFPVDSPYYVAWAPDGTVYALSRDLNGNSILHVLDWGNSRTRSLQLDHAPDALYPAMDGKNLILVSADIKRLSFGTAISNRVILLDRSTDRSTTIYSSSKTYILKNPDIPSLKAWTHAGPSPLDNAFLVMEHVIPPAVPSHTKVNIIDLASGEIAELTAPDSRKTYLSASWSPDGTRAALTDGNGRLEIRSRFGTGVVLDTPLAGMYPSWNPGGSGIYCGGHLIDSDGKKEETLLTDARKSIGEWSPDGKRLAVATGDAVLLFQNMRATYVPPDGPLDKALSGKLSTLKALLEGASITREEYNERLKNLILKSGTGQ